MGGRKGRDGLFPASDCIKVISYTFTLTFTKPFYLLVNSMLPASQFMKPN